jgi:fructose-1,6-bisphosphatase I
LLVFRYRYQAGDDPGGLSMTSRTLREYLHDPSGDGAPAPRDLAVLIEAISDSCRTIAYLVSRGALADVLGAAGTGNIQGEEQKKLDVLANDEMKAMAKASGVVAALASEEEDEAVSLSEGAPFLLLFDPLDGSSNIDVNVSIGTIFSVLPAREGEGAAPFLQPGRNQVAAGYCVYGPQTTLVLTLGAGVAAFTMDPPTGQWVETTPALRIPQATKEFSINMSNMRHWADPVRGYIDECLAGKTGPRGKDFNMRWVASMVADVHRIMSRGGVFMYPWDKREPDKPGKLRLMYEANPMSLLVEQAGGRAFDGRQDILDIQPQKLHQRVAVMLGSKEEVEILRAKHG